MAVSRIALGLSFAAWAAVGPAHATTLGELMDQGAQKLTASEAGAWGPLNVIREGVDSDARMTLQPDGTITGTVLNKQGYGSSEAVGTWAIDSTGRRCVDVALPAFGMKWNECGYAFRLGSRLYHVASDSDRAVTATPYLATAILRP